MVCQIPKGKVATYGTVALLAGNPRWARVVGYALHNNPAPGVIPCHRVVNREGKVADDQQLFDWEHYWELAKIRFQA